MSEPRRMLLRCEMWVGSEEELVDEEGEKVSVGELEWRPASGDDGELGVYEIDEDLDLIIASRHHDGTVELFRVGYPRDPG